ncbi:hypothetical protein MCERE19_04252 [Spirosomataceae bacterium]|jgi:hypothetical protein
MKNYKEIEIDRNKLIKVGFKLNGDYTDFNLFELKGVQLFSIIKSLYDENQTIINGKYFHYFNNGNIDLLKNTYNTSLLDTDVFESNFRKVENIEELKAILLENNISENEVNLRLDKI